MITRRDFAKLASFAAGSTLVPSGGEAQEKQGPANGNPAAVTSGFIQNAGAEIYYECTGSGPAVLFAHGLGGNHLSWWQQVPIFHITLPASLLLIADFLHLVSRLELSILHCLKETCWRWLIILDLRKFGSLHSPWEDGRA